MKDEINQKKSNEKSFDEKLKKQVDSVKKMFDSYNKSKKLKKTIKDNNIKGGNTNDRIT